MLKVIFSGNLGGDPEKRYTQDGRAMLQMNVAVNTRRRGQDGEWADHTDWFRVRVMGNRAETLSGILTKGARVFITGSLQVDTYQAKDGSTRVSLDVFADDLDFTSSRSQVSNDSFEAAGPVTTSAPSRRTAPRADPSDVDLEDLPF